MVFYDADDRAMDAVADIESEFVLVVTDPLLLAPANLSARLQAILETTDATAALPASNEAASARQQMTLRPYMTLRELEVEVERLHDPSPADPERTAWNGDPGVYLTRTRSLGEVKSPLRQAIEGREVAISRNDFVHRWASMRGQVRDDLLSRISTSAKSILEFGCGEGVLGAALKQRQKCRVVGIEIDQRAVSLAKKRLDDVYCGDVNEIVALLQERFDAIVGGDIVEHLDEPWTFLADLRRIAAPGAQLLLSLPNISHASIVADLLQGRFDYVYMGLTCAGHLRFFTKRTIEDLLTIAGWEVAAIEPQQLTTTPESEGLIAQLDRAGIPYSREDLLATGYYVTGRNPI
jgi:2-polyprenyl-3-methyl-5-hydroxy-6-metoxy-1,4-benzoquinol methylase